MTEAGAPAIDELARRFASAGDQHLRIAPCTVKAALAYVRLHHRRLPEIQGGLFAAAAVSEAGDTVGVGIAGNPARVWQGPDGL